MSPLIDEPVEIAVVDYGMGNRRSVEKALAHVGASAIVSGDPERLRGAAGLVVPGVGAFPRAMERLRALGLDELLRERVGAGTPVLGICLGLQLAFEHSSELGGADGLGIIAGEVRPLRAGELKLPHIGWNEVRFSKPTSPLVADLPRECAFYHVHSFAAAPAREQDVLGTAELRRAVRDGGREGLVLRRAVPPREVLRRRLAPAGELRAHLRRRARHERRRRKRRRGRGRVGQRQVNLYPAIDILGGNAVRLVKGDFDAKQVYDEDPLSAARAFVDAGARYLHVVDLDGAKRGEPVNVEHLRAIVAQLGLPVQYGGGLRTRRGGRAGARRGRLARDPRHGRVRRADLLARVLDAHGAERVLVSIDARGGYVATHGWLEATEIPVREAIERLHDGGRGAAGFVFTNIDHDGMLDGPSSDDAEMVARAVGSGSVILSGGIGEIEHLRAIARLRAEQRLHSIDGVIVGKALYERRFTVGEALEALAG